MAFTAGITFEERQDFWPIVPNESFSIGVHIEALKGRSFVPVLKTSPEDWVREFGAPDPIRTPTAYAALLALQTGKRVYTIRVHSGATIAWKNYGATSQTQKETPAGIDEDETGIDDAGIFTDVADALLAIRARSAGAHGDNLKISILHHASVAHRFTIEVYDSSSGSDVLVETFDVSRTQGAKDAGGKTIYVEDVVNPMSEYIYVYDKTDVAEATRPGLCTKIVLAEGDDGSSPDNSDFGKLYDAGGVWETNTTNIYNPLVDVVLEGGLAADGTYTLAAKMTNWAERNNSFVLLGIPQSIEANNAIASVAAYRTALSSAGITGKTGSFAALHSSWMWINDPWNGDRKVLVPIEGLVAQVHARAASEEPWVIPAGTRRGRISVLEPFRKYSETERDVLAQYDINSYIVTVRRGVNVWDQRTLYGDNSARDSRVHVRKLFNHLKKTFNEALMDQAFEFITQENLDDFAGAVRATMRDIKSRGGVTDFRVIAEIGVNNTPQTLAARKFIVDVYVAPPYGAEELKFGIIATDFSLRFDEQQILSTT